MSRLRLSDSQSRHLSVSLPAALPSAPFQLDVINFISKTTTYEDATVTEEGNYLQPAYEHYANGPRIHEYLQEMHREVISRYDTITVGECPYTHDTSVLGEPPPPQFCCHGACAS